MSDSIRAFRATPAGVVAALKAVTEFETPCAVSGLSAELGTAYDQARLALGDRGKSVVPRRGVFATLSVRSDMGTWTPVHFVREES